MINRKRALEYLNNVFDDIELLFFVKDLLNIVVSDIEQRNDLANEEIEDLDFGKHYYIKQEDFESIVSAVDTIEQIKAYNNIK